MSENINKTNYAIGERLVGKDLENQIKLIDKMDLLKQSFDLANIVILVLNNFRQIIYANRAFLKMIDAQNYKDVLGKRPGELVNCVHANSNILGCGTSEACRNCGAVNTILKSIASNENCNSEASIMQNNGSTLNVAVNAKPFIIGKEYFYFVSFVDITDTVRRRELERIFFHDIINTAGSLGRIVSLVKDEVPEEAREDMEFVEDTFKNLVDEIQSQRQLLEAENNELVVDFITILSHDVLKASVKLLEKHDVARGKSLIIKSESENISFRSDYILLKRVICNMIKNALEETEKGGVVSIGCKKIHSDNEIIEFWVKNNKYIPKDIQYEIFKRSFSTKGRGRGLGTYSMKLLGEKYLGGQVSFETDEANGTTFFIRLPV